MEIQQSTTWMEANDILCKCSGGPRDTNRSLVMRSQPSSVVATILTEDIATRAADKKPSCWCRCYVDGTRYFTWPRMDALQVFNNSIKFLMDTKKDGNLHFLDDLVKRRSNGCVPQGDVHPSIFAGLVTTIQDR